MIFFDINRTERSRHRSGLTRVSRRLWEEFGDAVRPASVLAKEGRRSLFGDEFGRGEDWILTGELFSENEYPGFWDFLRGRRCKAAAIFHDAIPLKHPHITWPHSVSRHPEYMKMLASFDCIFAVSEASLRELDAFWCWQGVEPRATLQTIALGADFVRGAPRVTSDIFSPEERKKSPPILLCVGILEPRKNQTLLLEACEVLWAEGLAFELHFVGRVNPHFGHPIVSAIEALGKRKRTVFFHREASDSDVVELYHRARVSLFPSMAEGCGLPLLESLWMGTPCVCSDLPVLKENAHAGGCLAVATNNRAAWIAALRRVITDGTLHAVLRAEARSRFLPTWAETATSVRQALT